MNLGLMPHPTQITQAGGVVGSFEDEDIIDAVVSTTHTHTSMAFGAEAADRIVIVGLALVPNSTQGSTSSVTIGGVAATQRTLAVGSSDRSEIWTASVPTGTTGNVVIVTTTNLYASHAFVWRMVGGSETPTDTGTDTDSNPATNSLDIVANGFAVGVVVHRINSPGTSYTWSGITVEDYDGAIFSGAGEDSTAAHESSATTQTLSVSVTAADSGIGNPILAVASFPPA